jgi:acyl transferase domain-containing protein/NADPH:quinone reductase-like Zn-dependent oxidoreductase/acyl carrier protein
MSDLDDRLAQLSPEKRALLAKRMRQQSGDRLAPRAAEPIAIVGMACRLPGGTDTPDAFWSLLAEGVDAITEVPPDRWDGAAVYDPDVTRAGYAASRHGGFLRDIDAFDAGFFGISPREAARMDPQQRLFLEVAWEALEDAGQDVATLAGSDTGVFVGLHSHAADYFWFDVPHPERMDSFTGTGTSHNVVAGRLSYLFDFHGPAIVVDTACSSSLVAIHLACQSLRTSECSLAVAGGVNLILSPVFTIALSRLGMLSPDGRCRAFDHRANGFVRSEGCGVITLKRLADARLAGDRVLAVIRGSAVNQDGRTNGITAPNTQSQQRVITRALAHAGVAASEVGYVEAHGTGTTLGDPIEMEALAATVGAADRHEPCFLGSAKANIGHLEGAAGVTGVIKAVLSLQHKAIPPLAHFQTLNPHISLDGARLAIPTTLSEWPGTNTRIAGVSSFGWSGTNAHVVIEEAKDADPVAPESAPKRGAFTLPISARSESALRELAGAYAALLESVEPSEPVGRLVHAAAVRRTHHDYRLAVAGSTRQEIVAGLRAHLAGDTIWPVAAHRAIPGRHAPVTFVFSGQGPQWPGMGRELLASDEVFRAELERVSARFETLAGWSIVEALLAEGEQSKLQETEVAQPALFAVQAGLAAFWKSLGIEPAAVVGHSVGEIAAAYVSGALTLDAAVSVVYHRARLMQRTTGRGRMVSVELSAAEAQRAVGVGGRVSIAALNAPASCVLSGEPAALDPIVEALKARGVTCQTLPVNYAFHSAQMDDITSELGDALQGIVPAAPRIPLISTVTGKPAAPGDFDAAYWTRNVRQTVRFSDAIRTLRGQGHRVFVEIGPHPVLASSITQHGDETPVVALPSLRRGRPEHVSLMATLGGLYVQGCAVPWRRIYPQGAAVPLPGYRWQRTPFWLPSGGDTVSPAGAVAHEALSPVWPGRRLRSPHVTGVVFEASISSGSTRWLRDHVIDQTVMMPAAALLMMAVNAARAAGNEWPVIEDFFLHRPLRCREGETWIVQTSIASASNGASTLEIRCQAEPEGDEWPLLVSAIVRDERGEPSAGRSVAEQAPSAERAENLDVRAHYRAIGEQGAALGPMFQTATRLRRGSNEARADVWLPAALAGEVSDYALHPTVVDGCLQAIIAALGSDDQRRGVPHLPQSIGRIRLLGHGDDRVVAHAVLRGGEGRIAADVRVSDAEDRPLMILENVALAEVRRTDPALTLLYREAWVPGEVVAPTGETGGPPWVIVPDAQGHAQELASRLRARGCAVTLADAASGGAVLPEGPARGVVCLAMLGARSAAGASAEALEREQRETLGRVLEWTQAIAAGPAPPPSLAIVTAGGQPVSDTALIVPAQATAWGFARVVRLEHPEIRCLSIDLESADSLDWDLCIAELLAAGSDAGNEVEVGFRGGRRYVRRLTAMAAAGRGPSLSGAAAEALDIANRGVLDELQLVEISRQPPAAGEIEIEVAASGLNFRDVLNALGMYPGEAGRPGSECAGIVTAVGSDVSGVMPGMAVMALADGAMASHVITKAARAVGIPDGLTYEQAAAVPIAFLTAEYALHDLARLAPGERVLIHAAAGGVGLAAVQIARRAGAIIHATASTPEKHRLLRAFGVEHVYNSRDLAFAAEVLRDTGGLGVDVALNSLAGDFIPATVSAMARGGRFVEIGKTGVWSPEQMHGDRPDIDYHVLYLGDVFERDPARTLEMLRSVSSALAEGALHPLPVRTFALAHAADAFRHMAQARHVGKVVLTRQLSAETVRSAMAGTSAPVSATATYLVTGGLGSLGLHVAKWLVDGGARHLVLMGRRPASIAATADIDLLRASGANVVIAQGDVGSRDDVDLTVARIGASMPPLRGIVHAAGVLDDAGLLQQRWDRVSAVMRPKVAGSWNLDAATRGAHLDFFVLFSGAAASLGSRGQANYAAANAFLDALAHARRQRGEAAVSINWGPWADSTMATGVSAETLRRWNDQGLRHMPAGQALELLTRVLGRRDTQVSAVDIDWARYTRASGGESPLLRLVAPGRAEPVSDSAPRLREDLSMAPPVRRLGLVAGHVRQQALAVLGLPASYALDEHQGLRDVGLDSLMAVELRNRLQADTRCALPTTLAFDCPTVDAIARFLIEVMEIDVGTKSAEAPAQAVSVDHGIHDLTDDEAAAALMAEIAALRGGGAHE